MSGLAFYVGMGFRHITDLAALDHLLFLVALVAPYRLRDWRQLLLVATAFTVGHSLTLALVITGLVTLPTPVIEFLIPVTIVAAALENLRHLDAPRLGLATGRARRELRPDSRRGLREFPADHVLRPDRAAPGLVQHRHRAGPAGDHPRRPAAVRRRRPDRRDPAARDGRAASAPPRPSVVVAAWALAIALERVPR